MCSTEEDYYFDVSVHMFDVFFFNVYLKKNVESFEHCIVEAVDILKYWSRSIMKEMKAVHIIGKTDVTIGVR